MTSGLLTNPRGKLIVTDSGFKEHCQRSGFGKTVPTARRLKAYVQGEVKELVAKTKTFTRSR